MVQAAESLGIDENGLEPVERGMVDLLLRRGRPMGQNAIASRLGVDLETLRDVHEPWLERAGLIERTPWGRMATEEARELYGRKANAPADGRKEEKPAGEPRPGPCGPGAGEPAGRGLVGRTGRERGPAEAAAEIQVDLPGAGERPRGAEQRVERPGGGRSATPGPRPDRGPGPEPGPSPVFVP